jgi:CubicO group peptidase (beta-lactamase class C family)
MYSTGDYHLLSAVLTQASGKSTLALANEWLAEPMGFRFDAWTRDPQGIYMGGNNMSISPRNMIRIGEMVINGGLDGDTRVVSRERLEEAWTPRTRSPFSGHQYGYGWFLTEMAGMTVGFARGYGGQMIYVVPEVRAVLAVTSDPTRPARSAGYAGVLNRLLENDILPRLT